MRQRRLFSSVPDILYDNLMCRDRQVKFIAGRFVRYNGSTEKYATRELSINDINTSKVT